MTTLQRCLEYLDRHDIRYFHSGHPIAFTALDVARAEHLPAAAMAKTVVFYSDHTGYAMAVVPANSRVDLEKLMNISGAHHVRLATEFEIGRIFAESELGAMPPFGPLFDMPVFVDEAIARQPSIAFNAGTHRDVIHMSFRDFRRLVEPLVASFARQGMMATSARAR